MTKIHRITCEFSRSLDPEEIDSNKADYTDTLLLKYKQQPQTQTAIDTQEKRSRRSSVNNHKDVLNPESLTS